MTVSALAVRRRVAWRVAGFADPDYQARVWVRGEMPAAGYLDSFSDAVNDLFTDLNDGEGGLVKDVGAIFETVAEAQAVESLLASIDRVLPIRFEPADEPRQLAGLFESPAWHSVIEVAKAAHRMMGCPSNW